MEAEAGACSAGTRAHDKVVPSNEAESHVEQAQLQLHSLPSYVAVPVFNRLVDQWEKVAALVDVPCWDLGCELLTLVGP